jgi:spermidine synthase
LAALLLIGLCISLYNSLHAKPGKLVDVDTRYSRIWVKPWYAVDNRPVLSLRTDSLAIQSGMFLDKDDELVFRYSKYYRMADFFNPSIKDALVIGGAAYSYPKDFLKNHGAVSLDVVEIDPGMTAVAKKYFNLKDDDRLHIYHEDGRVFLNKNQKKYGAIFVDAFNSQASVPYQLTTKEAVQRIYDSLSDDGVVMANVISAIDGPNGRFFRAEYATYKEVFPQVFVFQVYSTDPTKHQNLIMVGLKKEWKKDLRPDSAELKGYMDMIYKRPIEKDVPALTDDHAPVDYYMMNIG